MDGKIAEELVKLISAEKLDDIAHKTGFVKRTSKKISGKTFFDLHVVDGLNACLESLESISTYMAREKNIEIASQSIDERYNEQAVEFFKTTFEHVLVSINKNCHPIATKFTNKFNRINLSDSSVVELPGCLEKIYKGFGGNASKAAAKIQHTFDIKSGNIINVDIRAATENDSSYTKQLEKKLCPEDLSIEDLGYYCASHFDTISKSSGYYLSRLKTNVKVYIKNAKGFYVRLDLVEESKKLKEKEIKEIKAFIGKQKLECRLIISRLPQEAIDKKIQSYIKKKQALTQNTEALSIVNMYITNVPEDILEKEAVYAIYSIRWQIEIFFKILKSIFSIDKIKDVKIERILCHFYSTLIRIAICSKIVYSVRNIMYYFEKKEISEYKTFKIVNSYLKEIIKAMFSSVSYLKKIIINISESISNNGMKKKKKDKKTVLAILSS